MIVPFLEQFWSRLRPRRMLDGGTKTRTRSGELRWHFRNSFNEEEEKKCEHFQRVLMSSEPYFRFAPFARAMRALPESERYSKPDWCKVLSVAASTYLAGLDRLQTKKPLVAIKVAAIGAATAHHQYFLRQEIMQRVSKWLSDDRVSLRDRSELGLVIQTHWPDRLYKLNGLEEILLDLLVSESATDPDYVLTIVKKYNEHRPGFPGYVISSSDDPEKILVIGRNLRIVDPEFCKNALRNYLWCGRLRFGAFEASEAQLRSVADEYCSVASGMPAQDEATNGFHYFTLSAWAYPDADWYPMVLERLLAAAGDCNNPVDAAKWQRSVALNADPKSDVFSAALQSYAGYLQSYPTLATDDRYKSLNFARFLIESVDCALKDRTQLGRNFSIPPNPEHPLVSLTRQAYWGLVEWANELPTGIVLRILVEGLSNDDAILATAAADKIVELFEVKAIQDPDEAAEAVGKLDCFHWYTGVSDTRRARCLGVWHKLKPALAEISPEAANKAEFLGRNPMWDR